jgi:hypothetical protein
MLREKQNAIADKTWIGLPLMLMMLIQFEMKTTHEKTKDIPPYTQTKVGSFIHCFGGRGAMVVRVES